MYRKIGVCLSAVILIMGLMTGCMEWENTAPSDPVQTPPAAETEPQDTGEDQPSETPSPEPTPSITPTSTPSPTPEPKDLPTIIGEYLDSVPALIMGEDRTSGTVAPDEVFVVALEETVSTGYLWQWEGDAACVLDTHWEPETEEPAAGVPGMHLWAFRFDAQGKYTLDFILVAPDGGVGDVHSMTVTVE